MQEEGGLGESGDYYYRVVCEAGWSTHTVMDLRAEDVSSRTLYYYASRQLPDFSPLCPDTIRLLVPYPP